jgi:peptidoglycan L-alanyl-D-glutamate endopeptidase CwlK
MPNFSKRSIEKLSTCHEDLREIMLEAIKETDFAVICGHRGKADQELACAQGNSQTPWPRSKHNKKPSLAVDIVPFPVDWDDTGRFKDLAKVIMRIAEEKGIKIKWGGDWRTFIDMPHFELVEE